ncbi:AIPR family protein [Vibrio cholerae]|uniref:AIPR family protein n=1 Tax=Vibrio cholerae TaxID=666 RepID=UPI003016843D
MHIILENQVNELSDEYELNNITRKDKLFEYFCNFCVTSKHFLGRFNPIDVTTDEDDASIDGLAIVIDGELILTVDDAEACFNTHKTNLHVDIIFTQVKSGELFKKTEISNFKLGLDDFLSLEPKLPNGKFNLECISILNVILKNLKKVRNRRPNAKVYYCTSGIYKDEREISACFEIIKNSVERSDLFHNVAVEALGRSELLKLYSELTQKNEAKLKLIDYFGMPEMPGIPQAYVAIANANSFINSLLKDSEGNLKQSVFEENVRSYLGEKNDVNTAIKRTLTSAEKQKLFSVLNNGITISSPELTLTPNTKEVNLTNYQIINGCQTSNTLYENQSLITDDVNVIIKLIESPNTDISADVISATNSQSDISKEAFFGLRDKAKLVQKYFIAKNTDVKQENRIYFERRQGEFRGLGYQATRIFDVKEVARCYSAMFLNSPHNSFRYVKAIFTTSQDRIFHNDDAESYYYASCLALYKYQTLINGRKINAHNYIKRRWHIIQAFKWICHGKVETPEPSSKKADAYAQKIINVLNSNTKSYIKLFEDAQSLLDSVGQPTDDELKRARFATLLLEAAREKFKVNTL